MQKAINLTTSDARLNLSLFGAQVLGWKIADKEILFDNPLTITDGSKPLRTGAPVCFPWFNKGVSFAPELKPSHGTARISNWQLVSQSERQCGFSYATNSYLNLPLQMEVTYSLADKSLNVEFKVINVSSQQNQFELALHTYFATPSPEQTIISGITDSPDFVPAIPIDKIFVNNSNPVIVKLTDKIIEIDNHNFAKSVVWHPGLNHGIKDLEDGEQFAKFICVESLSDVITLEQGRHWQSSITYTVSS